MGIFKRRRSNEADDLDAGGDVTGHENEVVDDVVAEPEAPVQEAAPQRAEGSGAHAAPDDGGKGPYDITEAPEDEMPRLDLGSVKIPVPDGAQLQVEMDPEGPLRAVHLMTPIGQYTISAFAAPRSGGLWSEVSDELVAQLRNDGATVRREEGEWGEELAGTLNDVSLRFLGVDGPRWMLRGVVAGPEEHAEYAQNLLRDIVRYSVVDRGDQPFPAREPLPVVLPQELAEHIEAARAEQQEQEGAQG